LGIGSEVFDAIVFSLGPPKLLPMPAECPQCGASIPEGTPGGWCPQCAFSHVLKTNSVEEGGTDALLLHDIAPPLEATATGGYQLIDVIGQGGMGVVYLARQEHPIRRKVALKVIKSGMDSKSVLARFEAERQALAIMDHPHIAKVFDAGATPDGRPYFAMELVLGTRIIDYCNENRLSVRQRIELFVAVCHAVQHAHQKGIIHRDLKPSNILVATQEGLPVPKVIDFGIAKATEGKLTDLTILTEIHQFVGTPAYISPEQAAMNNADIDTRADIYSLGVLLYELLTGRTPFDASELLRAGFDEMRRTIREKEPPRPSTRLTTLNAEELAHIAQQIGSEPPRLIHLLRGDLDWIVMKALEKDRTRRYESANGFAQDLKRHLNNEPVLARPPSPAYRFHKAFRRNKLAFTAAAAVFVALAIGLALSTRQTLRARKAEHEQSKLRTIAESALKDVAVQAQIATNNAQHSSRLLYVADMNLAQQALNNNNIGRVKTLLDRHRPRPGEEDLRGWEWRYLWQQSQSGAYAVLTNRSTRAVDLSFSHDGQSLVIGWLDGRVDLWDVPSRTLKRWLAIHNEPARAVFSPVRNLIAATAETKTVRLYDLESGTDATLWRAPDEGRWQVRDMAFSSDGKKLIVYSAHVNPFDRDTVWVINISSSAVELRHNTRSGSDGLSGAVRLSPNGERAYLPENWRRSMVCIEVASGREIWASQWADHDQLTALDISPDGKRLAGGIGYQDTAIRIWDAETGRLVTRMEGHTGYVTKLRFSEDGQTLVSASSDQTVRFWSTSNWREEKLLRGHVDEVNSLALSTSAGPMASGSRDGAVLFWNEHEARRFPPYISTLELFGSGANQVFPIAPSLALLTPRGKMARTRHLKEHWTTEIPEWGNSSNVFGNVAPNVTAHFEASGRIFLHEWRGTGFMTVASVETGSERSPLNAAYHPRRGFFAWVESGNHNRVRFTRIGAGESPAELKSEVGGIARLAFNDNGDYLYGASEVEGPFNLWKLPSGELVITNYDNVRKITFAAGGSVLALGLSRGFDHEFTFYPLKEAVPLPKRFFGMGGVGFIAASPDGLHVAAGDLSGHIKWFDPVQLKLVDETFGHLISVFAGAFSSDGTRLASACCGREALKLWDVSTRQELLTLPGRGARLEEIIWSADKDIILAGPAWQAWRAPSWDEIAVAERSRSAPPEPPILEVLKSGGDAAQAEARLLETLRAQKRSLGTNRPSVRETLSLLWSVLFERRKFSEAEEVARELLLEPPPSISDSISNALVTRIWLGQALTAQGKLAEAEEILLEAWRVARSTEPYRSQATRVISDLADVFVRRRKTSEFDRLFQEEFAGPDEEGARRRIILRFYSPMLARQSRWREAVQSIRECRTLDPDYRWTWYDLPLVMLQLGDEEAYRAECRATLTRFKDTDSADIAYAIARVSSLRVLDEPDRQLSYAITRKFYERENPNPWWRANMAMADLRAGAYGRTIDLLEPIVTDPYESVYLKAQASFILTLARKHLGQHADATRDLARGQDLVKRELPHRTAHDLGFSWSDLIIAWQWMAQAEQLMRVSDTKESSATRR
jgi:eukaryotic-like serine/threonine-protein kinase